MFAFTRRSRGKGSPLPSGTPRRRGLRALSHDCGGASAVEFALLAVPFFGLVAATMEYAIVYWAQLTLDSALAEASRSVYTGAFQTKNDGKGKSQAQMLEALRSELCTKDGKPRLTMFACQNVRLNVSTSEDFSTSANATPTAFDPRTNETNWNASYGGYANGEPSAIMRVQAVVGFPVVFTIFNPNYTKAPGGGRLLQAAAVFRVEPYK